ncbi:DEAD/DEAH box helicase [Natroniella sulfidigena]|uniref:DEAD/DEAH box helicase n=1 Tax=Natroniella sulfidigena TaxID=723921 RepID=UPI00200B8479|nr:SNF2-related protein [Natroniella sulfidigena]MCK8817990.1 DEAD/DEAH box helicase [Natroniella sulfidigena]
MEIDTLEQTELVAMEELADHWQEKEFELLPHQVKTVDRVVNEMDGRALLADEVGLGKTIEAGMILKEYLAREEIETCLVLTPASLGYQWWNELTDKFKIDVFNNRKGRGWHYFNVIISSLDKAKREPHADFICERGFDLVIVDEAQRLKNSETMNWKFVNKIPKKYLLLLTATPIQNDLEELYNLVSLLRPDLFGDYSQFKEEYVKDKHQAQNLDQLQESLSEVMIRNRREDADYEATDRDVELISLDLTDEEKKLYDQITELIKVEYQKNPSNNSIFNLLTLQREVCSSAYAAAHTLEKMCKKKSYSAIQSQLQSLLEMAIEIQENEKIKVLEEILNQTEGKAIVFTEYRATQEYICYYLYHKGFQPVVFSGGLSDNQKERAKRMFMENGDVLISTEAGGEGINLQFCNTIINYDLPWNPMKVEQRIGRVHRLGQDKDVQIYNLSTQDTIEEKIVELLDKKINLFEDVIGDLDLVVKEETDQSLEQSILKSIIETEIKDQIS